MFEKIKKIGTWFKLGSESEGETVIKTMTGLGAVGCLMNLIHESVQETSNKSKLKESGIGALALSLVFLGLEVLEGKRTETNNNEKIRVQKAIDQSDVYKYEKKREADIKKYDAKIESDIKMLKARHDLHEDVQEESLNEPEETLRDEETLLSSGCKVSDLLQKQQNASEVPDLISGIIRPGDVHILAGKSGLGKSFYSLAFAFKFSCGRPTTILPSDVECKPQRVFYYDGELSAEEFVRRCEGNEPDAYINIFRIENPNFDSMDAFMDDVDNKVLEESSDAVVIVDNMYSLFEDLNSKSAKRLQHRIQKIQRISAKSQFKVTFVIVAHPTKDYDEYATMELKHIAGSSNFTNMASSITTVAPTRFGEEYSMIRVLKFRNGRKNSKNVFVAKMVDDPYPHPEYDHVDSVSDALPIRRPKPSKGTSSDENEDRDDDINPIGRFTHEEKVEMWRLSTEEKLSYEKIRGVFEAKGKSITRQTVGNYINEIKAEKDPKNPD